MKRRHLARADATPGVCSGGRRRHVLTVMAWTVVDFFMAVVYGVHRLARRRERSTGPT